MVPVGGSHLYDPAAFAAAGVQLRALTSVPTEYRQLGGEFVPDLSIIDVLMFNGRDTRQLLDGYELS